MDLFTPPTRDERQEEGRIKWINSKCKGTLEYGTGVGKTFTAIKCAKSVLAKYPQFRILVVVPTDLLKEQWIMELTKHGIFMNAEVVVINTVIKHEWTCDILIIDEIHRMAADTFSEVFKKVNYRLILGLTATLERLDGRHTIIEKHCPIIDTISLEEALQNGWVSDYVEYKVYVDADINEYQMYNKEFSEHFAYFGYNFDLAMKMVGKEGYKHRLAYRDLLCERDNVKEGSIKAQILKDVTYHAVGLMKTMQQRKKFIYNHPDKIRLTQLICDHRKDCKIVTFSATTEVAEKIKRGSVYTGKDSKKKSRITLEEFSLQPTGVLNTVKKADEGMDVPGLSVAVILGMDSSPTKLIQRAGRVIRFAPNKRAEIFTLVIRGTVEEEWFNKSHANKKYVTLDEEQLMHVLRREPFEEVKMKPMRFMFRQ